jgi:transcriptional repressor NrdR
MRCNVCGHQDSKVIDSRPTHDNTQIRRRRECLACQSRFTTYEILEVTPLLVIKKDGRREEFSREKLLGGLMRSCEKRPIPLGTLEKLVDSIATELGNSMVREVPFQVIGEMVLERLLEIDKIAYVRYASVYKDFKDPRDFLLELEHLFNLQAKTSPGGRRSKDAERHVENESPAKDDR